MYSVGDILWSDLTATQSIRSISDNVVPIAICCIATGDSNTPDGKSRFIGIQYMSNITRSVNDYLITWGINGSINNIGTDSSTDYNGIGNMAAIVATNNISDYPAFDKCNSYSTTGTSAGDWYLGSIKEMEAVYTNKNTINSQLLSLQTDYSSYAISELSTQSSYWASTANGTDYAYYIGMGSGYIHIYDRSGENFVLPMIHEDSLVSAVEYIKLNNTWQEVFAVYKKINDVWVQQTDFASAYSQDQIYICDAAQIDENTYVLYGVSSCTGKIFNLQAIFNGRVVPATWTITSGSQYATINTNGKVTIIEGTQNQTITVQAVYGEYSETKDITISYDNQLTIEGADTITGTSGNVIARYNSTIITPTWSITSGNGYATIDSTGAISITASGTITVSASYNSYTATKNIELVYDAGSSTETTIDENGNVTTETTTTTTDPQTGVETTTTTTTTINDDGSSSTTSTETVENTDGSSTTTSSISNSDGSSTESSSTTSAPDPETGAVTTETSSTTINVDGSSSETESTVVENEDGSSQSSSTTVNYDENGDTTGSSANQTINNSDGSSESTTTNYNAEGDPTSQVNNEIDTSGNSSTQDIEYDENGDPTVTGYSIDTSNNDGGSKDFNADGVNTEFYGFDATTGFVLDFHFIIDTAHQPANQNENHHNILTMKRATPSPWYGFQLRQSSTNKYVQLGTQFATGSNTNTKLPDGSANKVNGSSTVFEYNLTITYNPNLSTGKFVCVDHISNTTVYTSNLAFPDIQELRYLTICIGYALDENGDAYRYSNINVLNFNVVKLTNS